MELNSSITGLMMCNYHNNKHVITGEKQYVVMCNNLQLLNNKVILAL